MTSIGDRIMTPGSNEQIAMRASAGAAFGALVALPSDHGPGNPRLALVAGSSLAAGSIMAGVAHRTTGSDAAAIGAALVTTAAGTAAGVRLAYPRGTAGPMVLAATALSALINVPAWS